MTHPAINDPRPFLSVISWPMGATRESMAKLVSDCTGIDIHTLRLRLGQAPPSIIGQVDPNAAKRAIRAIEKDGGDAFSVTFADLYALGPARPIRSMSIGSGALALELRDGERTAVRFQDVWLLVQGMIREKVRDRPSAPTPRQYRMRFGTRTSTARALRAGAAGLAALFGEGYLVGGDNLSAAATTTTHARNKLHIHDARGGIYEIEGRRFNFEVLGEMKQYNDRANMEQLCDLLSHLAPDEIVDPYFPLWKPPPRHHQLRIEGEMQEPDRPFAFYSRWAALMYRHVQENVDAQMFDEEQ